MRTYTDYSIIYLRIITYSKLQFVYSEFWYECPVSSYQVLMNLINVNRKTVFRWFPLTVLALLILSSRSNPTFFLYSAFIAGMHQLFCIKAGNSVTMLQLLQVYFNVKVHWLYCKAGSSFLNIDCQMPALPPLVPLNTVCYLPKCLRASVLAPATCGKKTNRGQRWKVESPHWTESQTDLYLIHKTNRQRAGPCLICSPQYSQHHAHGLWHS